MNLFGLFKPRGATAPVARERLQILLAHERVTLGSGNLLAILRDEILAAVAKHIDIAPEAVKITMGQEGAGSTLEIDMEIPNETIAASLARQSLMQAAPAHAQ